MSLRHFITALVLISSVAQAEFKAAYVDIQRAVQEVEEGKAAKARLQGIADQKQKAFEKEQNALKAEVEAYTKQKATMDDKIAAAKEGELQKKMYDFQQKAQALQKDLADSERKELGTIFPKLETLLGQIAQREGLTMVFDRSSSGLAWAPASLDLTNELIRMYNTTYKTAGAAPTKGAATPAPAPGPTK
jgi:outer membrane protein